MKRSRLLGVTFTVLLASITMSANAALIGVLPATPGGNDYQAYYDDVTDLTWLANANVNGQMNWVDANAWASRLNINGVTGWRLPYTNPIDGTTADDFIDAGNGSEDRGHNVSAPGTLYAGSQASEMAYLFYNTLGNRGQCDPVASTVGGCVGSQPGWGLSNTGPFSNILATWYWSATDYAPNTGYAWGFRFGFGGQDGLNKSSYVYAWAVHTGQVPIPASLWLFGSGLLGLIGVARKKSA